jgi:cytochrome c-type biogenesis protein CcmH/NrfG
MTKTACWLALCFLLFTACSKVEEKNPASGLPPAFDHVTKSEKSQSPYYYGLMEEYRNTLQQDPDNLAALIGLGNACSESGAWREAIVQYQHVLRLDPRNADVLTDLGTAYRNIGYPDRAQAEYRKALEYEPGHLDARYLLGVLFAFNYHDYPAAIHVWQELLRIAPNHPQAEFMRNNIASFRKASGKRHD